VLYYRFSVLAVNIRMQFICVSSKIKMAIHNGSENATIESTQ